MKKVHTNTLTFAGKVAMGIGTIILLGTGLSLAHRAQDDTRETPMQAHNGIQQSSMGLEDYLGIFQLPNKVAFIAFTIEENALVATQLWDNKKYQLVQIDETTFESKEEGHKVEFQKSAAGTYDSAKILGRISTVKVGFDPTVVQQLSAEQLKRLEGTYVLSGDNKFEITIRSTGTGLTLKQLWDDKEINFTARSETFFLNTDNTFPLTFSLQGTEAVGVTCFEDDIWKKK